VHAGSVAKFGGFVQEVVNVMAIHLTLKPRAVFFGLAVLAVASVRIAAAEDVSYEGARDAALKKCHAIDPTQSQTGLLFNPDGYRSLFTRSACLQDAAVTFRDASVCADVKERTSIFFSSWGYSPRRCLDLVEQGEAADRRELDALRRQYEADGITMDGFRIERNGNGRDYDIVPSFTGRFAHTYTLTFDVVAADRTVRIYSTSTHVDDTSRLRLYLRRSELISRFPDFRDNASYPVRADLTLDVGHGGPSGYWRPALIDQLFPVTARSSSTSRTITF
jgi:hypothetical protein